MKKIGTGTVIFESAPTISSYASVVGKKESEGPLGEGFDKVVYDSRGGEETFESAESGLQTEAALLAMKRRRSRRRKSAKCATTSASTDNGRKRESCRICLA